MFEGPALLDNGPGPDGDIEDLASLGDPSVVECWYVLRGLRWKTREASGELDSTTTPEMSMNQNVYYFHSLVQWAVLRTVTTMLRLSVCSNDSNTRV